MRFEVKKTFMTVTYVEAENIEDVKLAIKEELIELGDLLNRADLLLPVSDWQIQPVNGDSSMMEEFTDDEIQGHVFLGLSIPSE